MPIHLIGDEIQKSAAALILIDVINDFDFPEAELLLEYAPAPQSFYIAFERPSMKTPISVRAASGPRRSGRRNWCRGPYSANLRKKLTSTTYPWDWRCDGNGRRPPVAGSCKPAASPTRNRSVRIAAYSIRRERRRGPMKTC